MRFFLGRGVIVIGEDVVFVLVDFERAVVALFQSPVGCSDFWVLASDRVRERQRRRRIGAAFCEYRLWPWERYAN